MKARQAAKELGITFHVGSQTVTPDAYVTALDEVGKLIAKAGVVLDRLDVGGGFPSIYSDESTPAPLSDFMRAIRRRAWRSCPIGERCRLMCEPGRALVAEAESLIVRVDARRGNELFINDGSYGTLFDAAHMGFNFPVRLVGRTGGGGASARAVLVVGPDLRHHRPHEGAVPAARHRSGKATTSRSATPAPTAAPSAGRFNGYGALRGGDPAR